MNLVWLLVVIYPWPVAVRLPGENEAMAMPLAHHAVESDCLRDLAARRAKAGPPRDWPDALVCVRVPDAQTKGGAK